MGLAHYSTNSSAWGREATPTSECSAERPRPRRTCLRGRTKLSKLNRRREEQLPCRARSRSPAKRNTTKFDLSWQGLLRARAGPPPTTVPPNARIREVPRARWSKADAFTASSSDRPRRRNHRPAFATLEDNVWRPSLRAQRVRPADRLLSAANPVAGQLRPLPLHRAGAQGPPLYPPRPTLAIDKALVTVVARSNAF